MTLGEIFKGLPEGERVLLHKASTYCTMHGRHDRITRRLWDELVITARQGGLLELIGWLARKSGLNDEKIGYAAAGPARQLMAGGRTP